MGLRDNARQTAEALGELAGRLREVKEELSGGGVVEAARRSPVGSVGPRTAGEITRGGGRGGGGGTQRIGGPTAEEQDVQFRRPLFGADGPLLSTQELAARCELTTLQLPGRGGTMLVYRCPEGLYPAAEPPARRSSTSVGGGGELGPGGQTDAERARDVFEVGVFAQNNVFDGRRRSDAGSGQARSGPAGGDSGSVVSAIKQGPTQPTAGERQIVDGLRGVQAEIGQLRETIRGGDDFGAGLRVRGGL